MLPRSHRKLCTGLACLDATLRRLRGAPTYLLTDKRAHGEDRSGGGGARSCSQRWASEWLAGHLFPDGRLESSPRGDAPAGHLVPAVLEEARLGVHAYRCCRHCERREVRIAARVRLGRGLEVRLNLGLGQHLLDPLAHDQVAAASKLSAAMPESRLLIPRTVVGGEAARIGSKLAFIGTKATGHRGPSERTYVTSLIARRRPSGSGGAAARSIQDYAGDQNDLAVAVGRQGASQGLGGSSARHDNEGDSGGKPELGLQR